jgi:hypothetical protein
MSVTLCLGSDGTSNRPLKCSSAGVMSVGAATLPLPSGAATESTLSSASAKLPAALGQTTMGGSMSVAIASDQGSLTVTPVGTEGNAWSNFSVVADDKSTMIDLQYCSVVTIMMSAGSATSYAIQFSQDAGTTWYDTDTLISLSGGTDTAAVTMNVGARYIQLVADGISANVYATVCGK